MVVFNELRLSDDKKFIIIDCCVRNSSAYDGMHISTVDLEYYTNFSETESPGEHSYRAYEYVETDEEMTETNRLHLRVSAQDVAESFGTSSLDGAVIYVYVTIDGEFSADDDPDFQLVSLGIIIDWQMLYKAGINALVPYVFDCHRQCGIPAELEQFVLFWNAIRLAAETCDWVLLNTLWAKFVHLPNSSSLPCNCS